MIVTTKELFRHAYGQYALGAYNINNLEQTVGLFRGNLGKVAKNDEPVNSSLAAPFIIQISRGARSYTDKRFLEAMIRTAEQVFPEAIFAVHLDHGTEEACYDSIDSGFYSSVMIDASHEPFEKNVEITRRVVERAHAKGVVVEAELGQLGGVEEDVVGSVCLTDPSQAAEFVEKTGCDSLAVAIGTSHGAYKFSGAQSLRFDVLE
ncbi:MAG: class II fructose-bisphosphate aldolase, partial [Thermoguttaceae bacterium]|nr:class II fructose-bisphosphate aldolase [Thermoguttaceae bacterium]